METIGNGVGWLLCINKLLEIDQYPQNDRYRNVLYQLSIAICGYLSKKRSLNSGKSTPNASDIVRKPFWMIYHCNQQLSSTLEIQISRKCLLSNSMEPRNASRIRCWEIRNSKIFWNFITKTVALRECKIWLELMQTSCQDRPLHIFGSQKTYVFLENALAPNSRQWVVSSFSNYHPFWYWFCCCALRFWT